MFEILNCNPGIFITTISSQKLQNLLSLKKQLKIINLLIKMVVLTCFLYVYCLKICIINCIMCINKFRQKELSKSRRDLSLFYLSPDPMVVEHATDEFLSNFFVTVQIFLQLLQNGERIREIFFRPTWVEKQISIQLFHLLILNNMEG